MASACERTDELVKEYLLFRGFTTTAKALDHEIKHDKDKGLRADRMVEQLMSYVGCHDLQHLREYWAHLNQRFFLRLEQRYAASVRKLEVSLLKLYIVNAHQSNRQDRVRDFFERIGAELQNQQEFRDWFVFPFLSSPADNVSFALYFTRQWQETVQLSLHNFLQVVLQAMPVPLLLNYDHDARKMQALVEENENLRNQLVYSSGPEKKPYRARGSDHSMAQPLPDLIYDFSGLADGSHESSTEMVSNERQKTSRRFPITLSTPLLKRNKQQQQQQHQHQQQQQQQQHQHQTDSSSRQEVAGGGSGGGQGNQSNSANQDSQSLPHSGFSTAYPLVSLASSSSSPLMSQHGGATSLSGQGQKSSALRSMSEPQDSAGMPQAEGAAPVPPGRKKGPRELTSFPPYTSAQVEGPGSGGRSSSIIASMPEQPHPDPQGHGQGDRPAAPAGPVAEAQDRASGAGAGAVGAGSENRGVIDPLLPIAEGKQCPFLVLSDDVYSEHRSAVCYSRFSLSGHHVASLDMDGIVKVWTWSPQPCTTATVMSRAPFLSLDWASKSDRWLLLGNQSGQIRLFDTREIKTFREASVESPSMRVTYLSTCPSTMMFASCLQGGEASTEVGKLAMWDLKTMKIDRYLPLEPQPVCVTCCVHSANGKQLLAACSDGCVRLYDVSQRQCVRRWRVGKGLQQTVQFASQDLSFFSMGTDGRLSEWSVANTEQPMRQVQMVEGEGGSGGVGGGRSSNGQLFSLNKDGTFLLFAHHRQGVICKMGDGPSKGSLQRTLDLSSHSDAVTTVDWSPCIDTPVCLTGGRDSQLRVATLLSQ